MKQLLAMVAFPFHGTALVVNVTFAILLGGLLWGMNAAGLLALYGLPALLILVPWFAKYCLVVARHAAHGRRESPGLSLENLAPFEIQPFALIAGLVMLHQALQALLGAAAAAAGLALVAPAAIAALAIEQRTLAAMNPARLLRYASGLGPAYPLLAGILALALWLCRTAIESGAGTLPTVFLVQSVLIATFHAIGRLLHAREHAIGYDRPDTPGERQAQRAQQRARRDLEERFRAWYQLANAGKPAQALDGIMAWVAEQGDDPEAYAELLERLLAWPDPTVGLAFARRYADRLARLGQHERTLEIFLRAYALDPVVRPLGEEATLRLAQQAWKAGRTDVALALYADFEERFPESGLLATALLEQARLLLVEQQDPAAAARLLERLEHEYPDAAARDDIRRLRARVRAAPPE